MTRDVCEHFNPVDLPCNRCSSANVQKSTLREAAQQALDALEESLYATTDKSQFLAFEAITALRAALADGDRVAPTEPVQEPVAWMDIDSEGNRLSVRQWSDGNRDEVPLYTSTHR